MVVPFRIAELEEFSELSRFFTCSSLHKPSGVVGGLMKSTALTVEPEHQIQPRGSMTAAR